jgi:hypothetical protein
MFFFKFGDFEEMGDFFGIWDFFDERAKFWGNDKTLRNCEILASVFDLQ